MEEDDLARLYPGSEVPSWKIKLPHACFKTAVRIAILSFFPKSSLICKVEDHHHIAL